MKASTLFGAGWDDDAVEVLWKDTERLFCRLWHGGTVGYKHAFIPFPIGTEQPASESITRLRHEYGLRDYVDRAWALRPVDLVHDRGRTMLVVDYTGGEPLDRLIDGPMEFGRFLELAVALTTALGRLHGAGLIHKDIQPANVLADAVTRRVWLTGFGIATASARERQTPTPPEIIAGTLAYMAPEQTGRMNRSVDARSDLYALGVTLYQMLTGVLPFTATDPMELVHCHVARRPVPPAERAPGVSAAVSAVVMKLLAKTPEDRYQTAAGVNNDLRRCLTLHRRGVRIEPFALAVHDVPDVLRIPETLYGRERSIQELSAAFERVATEGSTELVLVSGYPGIGKSSVVDELRRTTSSSKGIFAAGKCDQSTRDIPYATLAQALHGLVQMILRSSEAELARWRASIEHAVGPNSRLITGLVPELELVIGEQPGVPDLPPQDSRNRFQMTFRAFLRVFTRSGHPLVLFLDDLQWIDAATLGLVEDLVGRRETRHLLLIGAYRDNEVGRSHPLMLALDALRGSGTRIRTVELSPLTLDDVCRLIAHALHAHEERVRPLARLVVEKTGGNPFFAIQLLTELATGPLLSFDAGAAAWRWNLAGIGAKGYTDNLAQLMVGKLQRLPAAAQEALKELACLGSIAEFARLAIVRASSEEEVHATFRDAARAGLVIRLEGTYLFAHDRVQEAAYALIPQASRPEMHLRIGRRLRDASVGEPTTEHVFAIVAQLNRAVDSIADVGERRMLLRLNVLAGMKAKAGIAYAAARDYLGQAEALMTEEAWGQHYGETLQLHLALAECEYLIGRFDSADRLFELMLGNARSDLDRATIYSLRIKVYQASSRYDESVVVALEALQLFGVVFPGSDEEIAATTAAEFRAVSVNLGGRRISDLLDAPVADDAEVRAIIALLVEAAPGAYNGRPQLFPLVTMKAVNFALRYGNTEQAGYAYAVHALTLVSTYGDAAQAFAFSEMALRLNDKFGNARLRGALLHLHGNHVNFWRRPFATAVPILDQAFHACLEVGDFVYAGHIAFLAVWQAIERGDPLEEVQKLAARNAEFANQAHIEAVYQTIALQQQFIASLQGETSDPLAFDASGFEEAASLDAISRSSFGCGVVLHRVMKHVLAFLHGQFAGAMQAAGEAELMLDAARATPIEATHHFYHALTLTALYPAAPANEQEQFTRLLEGKLTKLRLWADDCPQNYRNRYALVLAEIARIEGRAAEAMDLYEEAIRSAGDNGFAQQEALAFELAARFYADRGFATFAHAYRRNARSCYQRWGARGKVRQMAEMYPELREEIAAPHTPTVIADTVEHLDLATVIKVSEAVSGEIVSEKLLDTVMRSAIEYAGAERGLLILPQADGLRIQAAVTSHGNEVTVVLPEAGVTGADLPESVLRYVLRTHESVLEHDASAEGAFAADSYIRGHRARSVLCLPLLKQSRLVGVLYLENNLAPHVFTPARVAVLKLLASEAAISMENTRLYADLQERESRVRRLVDSNIIGIFIWNADGRIIEANEAFLHVTGHQQDDLVSGRMRWNELTPADWVESDERGLANLQVSGVAQPYEKEFFRKDGTRVSVLVGAAVYDNTQNEGVAFVVDLSERKEAEEAARASERRYHEIQSKLTHANRIAAVAQLGASIAHEISQPLSGIITNASTSLRMLDANPPNLAGARETARRTLRDGNRAADVIARLRALFSKKLLTLEPLDLNEATREVIALSSSELQRGHVDVRTEFADDLPSVPGDRVQLQQVILNLLRNASEAMDGIDDRPRRMVIRTARGEHDDVRLSVEDVGVGLDTVEVDRLFEAFYTTKTDGMGIGLSVSRSIIESHEGRLWATANDGPGITLAFCIPIATDSLQASP